MNFLNYFLLFLQTVHKLAILKHFTIFTKKYTMKLNKSEKNTYDTLQIKS